MRSLLWLPVRLLWTVVKALAVPASVVVLARGREPAGQVISRARGSYTIRDAGKAVGSMSFGEVVYQRCFECGQVYATAVELLEAHNQILAADGLALETDPGRVVPCPACGHDFLYPPDASAAGSMSDATTARQLCGDLPMEAARIAEALRRNGFDPATAVNRHVLGLAEEAGEFVGAYRRWSGQARRAGTADEMFEELADVIITAFVTAHELGIDVNEVIAAKLHKVHTRGWREVPR